MLPDGRGQRNKILPRTTKELNRTQGTGPTHKFLGKAGVLNNIGCGKQQGKWPVPKKKKEKKELQRKKR